MNRERLLVATDFSPCSERAVDYAIAMAAKLGRAITFLHVDVWRAPDDHGVSPPPSRPDDVPDEAEVDARLAALLVRAEDAGIAADTVCRRSLAIGPTVMQAADDLDAAAIVMATHGYTGMRRFILGSNTEEVLRTTSRNLFIVPGGTTGSEVQAPNDGPVIAPVDLSGSTEHQARAAAGLAEALGAELILAYVIEPVLPGLLTGFGTLGDLSPSLDEQIERELRRIAARTSEQMGREVAWHIARGNPAREIADLAEAHGASLLVMARHGLSRIERFFLGSVTERVARASAIPVLVLADRDAASGAVESPTRP